MLHANTYHFEWVLGEVECSGEYAEVECSGEYAEVECSGEYAEVECSGEYAEVPCSGEQQVNDARECSGEWWVMLHRGVAGERCRVNAVGKCCGWAVGEC
jgi:hypothetical protein